MPARNASLIAGLTQATQATLDTIGAPAESVRILLDALPDHDFRIGGQTTKSPGR